MKTTVDFLNAVMEKHGIKSDNQLSLFLGCARSGISGYRHKKTYLDDHIVLKVADALEIDAAYVMACVHAERAKQAPEKAVWERLATMSLGLAATVLIVLALPYTGLNSGLEYVGLVGSVALQANGDKGSLYIMSN